MNVLLAGSGPRYHRVIGSTSGHSRLLPKYAATRTVCVTMCPCGSPEWPPLVCQGCWLVPWCCPPGLSTRPATTWCSWAPPTSTRRWSRVTACGWWSSTLPGECQRTTSGGERPSSVVGGWGGCWCCVSKHFSVFLIYDSRDTLTV